MSEHPKPAVRATKPRNTEDNRILEVELWQSPNHAFVARLTREEALDLSVQISNHFYWLDRDAEEAAQ